MSDPDVSPAGVSQEVPKTSDYAQGYAARTFSDVPSQHGNIWQCLNNLDMTMMNFFVFGNQTICRHTMFWGYLGESSYV